MQNFKELKVWQRSHQITLKIYKITKNFPREELYGLISQMRRSSASVPTNIAEGCGRGSNAELAK
jgi:four helix bundle protein